MIRSLSTVPGKVRNNGTVPASYVLRLNARVTKADGSQAADKTGQNAVMAIPVSLDPGALSAEISPGGQVDVPAAGEIEAWVSLDVVSPRSIPNVARLPSAFWNEPLATPGPNITVSQIRLDPTSLMLGQQGVIWVDVQNPSGIERTGSIRLTITEPDGLVATPVINFWIAAGASSRRTIRFGPPPSEYYPSKLGSYHFQVSVLDITAGQSVLVAAQALSLTITDFLRPTVSLVSPGARLTLFQLNGVDAPTTNPLILAGWLPGGIAEEGPVPPVLLVMAALHLNKAPTLPYPTASVEMTLGGPWDASRVAQLQHLIDQGMYDAQGFSAEQIVASGAPWAAGGGYYAPIRAAFPPPEKVVTTSVWGYNQWTQRDPVLVGGEFPFLSGSYTVSVIVRLHRLPEDPVRDPALYEIDRAFAWFTV